MTRRYVAETYRTLARCLAAEDDDALRGGRVEQVVVRGGRATLRLVEGCPAAVADHVAAELVRALRREGRSPAFLRCMRRELRAYLTVTGLGTRALRGNANDAGTAAIGGVALGAQRSCTRAAR